MKKCFGVVAAIALVSGMLVAMAPQAHAAQYCFGRRATIVGTAGPNTLFGSPYRTDVIVGLGGNDYISGGNDYPENGDPPDYICAGPGADEVYGGPGADHMLGGDGADYLEGSFGADYIDGNVGDDQVLDIDSEYESVPDTLKGSQGNDFVFGDYGADILYGGDGADHLKVGSCVHQQKLYGGPGNDRLEAWEFSYGGGSCSYSTVSDRVQGDGGYDTAEVNRQDYVTTVERKIVR